MRSVLFALLATACVDYDITHNDKENNPGYDSGGPVSDDTGVVIDQGDCDLRDQPRQERGVGDACTTHEGGFTPIVEWRWAGSGAGCTSQPLVADMDGDGVPEIVLNAVRLFVATGDLVVLHGDGSGVMWQDNNAMLAYGSPPAIADLDHDGHPEIVVVREYQSALFAVGDYRLAAYDYMGNELWETPAHPGLDFDWATAPTISDMDHDGSPEIVAGRAIFNADGSLRGVGAHGRGSYGITEFGTYTISESSVSAVTDINLDGVEEVIVGDAMYDPDGNTIWYDAWQEDAMISVLNIDDDPEGEWIGITGNTIRAVDTDGTVLWGPTQIRGANILATAAVGDLDNDGYPEIVTAGGNAVVVLNHDGTELWRAQATDESGATGASIFDFEGDGWAEVVYIDEVEMVAYDGATGAVKFYNPEHDSATMFDYPTIADVDADDQAEIVICTQMNNAALVVFGDRDESWRPARHVWNQHGYSIGNINDDLSVPTNATPSFASTNTWHSAIATRGVQVEADVTGEFVDICLDECANGRVLVQARAWNLSTFAQTDPINVALYVSHPTLGRVLVGQRVIPAGLPSGFASGTMLFEVPSSVLNGAEGMWLSIDDDGTGNSQISECSEADNLILLPGPFCD